MTAKQTRLQRAGNALQAAHAAFHAALDGYSNARKAEFRTRMPRKATKHAVRSITHGNRTWEFHKPFNLTTERDPSGCGTIVTYAPAIYSTDFGVGFGPGEKGAIKSFAETFAECWDVYAIADPDTLSLDAQALRKRLRDLVKRVKPARKRLG